MSRVYKKILSLLGLALVIGVTVVAAGIPPVNDATATSSEIGISVTIESSSFDANIVSPEDGAEFYDGNNNTATINYVGASEVEVYLISPSGTRTLIHSETPSESTGQISGLPLDLGEYGDYILEVNGLDLSGNTLPGDTVEFSFHAISASGNEDGTVHVNFGAAVCRLRFEVYDIEDTSFSNVLIDYFAEDLSGFPGYPNYVDVEIPGFAQLDGSTEYVVVVSAYDCAGGTSPLEEVEANLTGVINPPNTGSLSIFGIAITKTDYLITGLIMFAAVTIFAFFLLRRKKNAQK